MLRNRFDAFCKDALVALLSDVGTVERGTEAAAEPQRIDVLFRPDAEHHGERVRRGLLGALVDEVDCDLEPFRNTPSVPVVRACVRRLWTYHHDRELASCRDEDGRSLPMFRAVVLSPGRPDGAIDTFRAVREPWWPDGVYTTHAELGLVLVALSELPSSRDTLALRLLGRGATLTHALRELEALPHDAWERTIFEILVRWRHQIELLPIRNSDDEDFMSTTEFNFEAFKSNLLSRGRDEGRNEGLRPLAHQFERRLGRSLTTTEHATLLARLDLVGPDRLGDVVLDLTPDALAAWLGDPGAR